MTSRSGERRGDIRSVGRDIRHGSESDARSRCVGRADAGRQTSTSRDVLELGPGTGKNTTWIAKRARSVIGLDASAGMLAIARRAWRRTASPIRVHFSSTTFRPQWPIADESIDVIVVDLVLEHVERVGHVFAEAARVLRFDGQSVHLRAASDSTVPWAGERISSTQASREVVDVPVFRHTVSEFVNGGIDAGFTVERLDDWFDADRADAPPRLLSVLFRKR